MLGRWQAAEYSHGPAIPWVVLFLLGLRSRDLARQRPGGSWPGVVLLAASVVLIALGERTAFHSLSQYGLVLALWSVAWASAGTAGLRVMAMPLLLLVLLVPLPAVIESRVTAGLQALSSGIGVEVIRLAGLRAFREGNVIDLGGYQLLVAEACSGLRYLFPLMAFGLLCAVLLRARPWQRALLVLAVVPIAVFMNSVRVGVTGILVNLYGRSQAEGFLHYFEGWVIFMACVLMLFGLVGIVARMERRNLAEIFGVELPARTDIAALLATLRPNRPAMTAMLLVVVAALLAPRIPRPPALLPERAVLDSMPLNFASWRGEDNPVGRSPASTTQISDELLATFSRPGDRDAVELRVAYCDSQSGGPCVQSPRTFLPGGDWNAEASGTRSLPVGGPDRDGLRVNRRVVARGDERQLVYYWFDQRGRRLTSEFAVAWYNFRDSLIRNRTDGALVRVSTAAQTADQLPAADARLEAFLVDVAPQLGPHLPGDASLPPAGN